MAEIEITSLETDGVTTRPLDEAPADIVQEIWTALKTGNFTITWDR